ncbi:flagellar filament capping protein FliD [Paenibacillus sp. FSL L8-0323]|uniref:flagellar filament capping protein FliD n=1 Tax=Paenibacillus TaxID=44249 RepID=UPI0004F712C5|nr:flagellar filament capping protein FliD [Paenibacillus odorifer]AIQ76833.1 flagellar capping protein [Paenibacillus odorifer]OMD12277.1 flagellar capping protein [Paenibacillus odorifer]OMD25625.1 flagellar capping protein [Paenibacillus odorifer]
MVLRVNGFSSGMDIDSIVKQMMSAKRQPLDKLNQQKTLLEWQRDSYRELNSKLVDFKANKLSSWNKQSQMNAQKAVVSGNTLAVKAEANADANGVEMSVQVTKLATKSSLESTTQLTTSSSEKATIRTKLSDMLGATTPLEFKVDGGVTLTFTDEDTISSAISKINSSSAGVTASFDEVSGRFTISAKEYGADNVLEKNKLSGSFLSLMNVGAVKNAENAEVYISSGKQGSTETPVKYTPSSNNFTVNGIQLTLQGLSGTAGTTTIATQTDPTKAIETIKSFVEAYNELISLFTKKTDENKYRDFAPLTSEQKEAMKESEITTWEEKAKSGLLKNDAILKSTVSDFRSVITSKLGDLSSFGITTGQYFENGKLYINEEKLKQALTDNPEKVTSLFQTPSGGSGIFTSLSTLADKALDKIVLKAGTSKFSADINSTYKTESVMGRLLKDYNSRIDAWADRLTDMETRYYKQFTAMETAMSKYNSQSSSLSSFMSS